jgi:hypothetical protein
MSNKALVIHSSNYSITGGASRHIAAAFHSLLVSTALTVTLTGTPAFTTAFAESADGSMVLYSGHTFTGSATGPRFIAQRGGYIRTGTASLTYLPGTTSGTIATGGNYESLYTLGNLDGTTLGATTPAPATVTTLTVNSTLDVNGQQDMHNNNMKGIKAASMNGGVSTSGTTGAVTVNWSSGALINQSALTGAPTYTFTPPTNTNTWLTLMGGAAVNPTPSHGPVASFGTALRSRRPLRTRRGSCASSGTEPTTTRSLPHRCNRWHSRQSVIS